MGAQTTRRAAAAVLAAAVTAPALVSCGSGSTDPTAPAHAVVAAETGADVVIGASGDPLQQALAEKFRTSLGKQDRTATVETVPAAERLARVESGDLTMVTGCVGELLDVLDAGKGRELRELYREAQDEGTADASTWRDITHSTMVSALPTDLQATDPGIAVACDDDTLPQNAVALYRKTTMDRTDRKALNDVSGGVDTATLRAAADTAE